jgi:uncharacterized protein with PIN domain
VAITLRVDAPSEPITFFGHRADCRYCNGGIVKMRRGPLAQLLPRQCWCLQCGQPYHVEVKPEDLDAWDMEQWRQKARREG